MARPKSPYPTAGELEVLRVLWERGPSTVREVMAARAEKRVFFEIDDDAIYGDAMHVMDVCRGAGVKTLGLMTKTP